jgi:glucose-1-phosphate thymidylyltransferase
MLANISDISIISTPRDIVFIEALLGNGHQFGLNLTYLVQDAPNGIAQAFNIAAKEIHGSKVCLILGDNLFYGQSLPTILLRATEQARGATIFAYRVKDPEKFGVVEFDEAGAPRALIEKPKIFKSSWAVPGIYFYDETVVDRVKDLKPSPRGELEITDLNISYLNDKLLRAEKMSRGIAWLDTGTPQSLIDASAFVKTIEDRQGLKIACLEEIALFKKFISRQQLSKLVETYPSCDYTDYLEKIVEGHFDN